MNAIEFEIAFYEAIFKWVSGGKVGLDPRGEWEYSDISGKWHQTFAPSVPEWDLTAYRWKPTKKRTIVIDSVELVAPEVGMPMHGASYWYESWCGELEIGYWQPYPTEFDALKNGKIFLTKEDCQAMADAQRKQRMGGVS